MKHFTTALTICLCFTQQLFSQSILFTSGFGGANGNGAMVNYNVSNSTLSTPISLAGNPLGMSQPWIEGFGDYYNSASPYFDDETKENGLYAGSDGYVYGIDTRAGKLTTNDLGAAVLYRFHPDSLKIEVLHQFTGNGNFISNGSIQAFNNGFSKPRFGLIEGNPGMLYGICIDGGANNLGGIWKYDMVAKKYIEMDYFDGSTIGFNVTSPLFKALNNDVYGITGRRSNSSDDGVLYKIDLANDTLVYYHNLSPGTGLLLGAPKGKVVYDQGTHHLIGCRTTDVTPSHGGGFFMYDFNTNTSYNISQIWNDWSVLGSFLGGAVRGNDGNYYAVTDGDAAFGYGALIKTNNPGPANCTMLALTSFKRRPCGNSLLAVGSKIIGTYKLSGETNHSDKSLWAYDVLTNTMLELFPESYLPAGADFLPQMAVIGNTVYIRYVGGGDNNEGGILALDANNLTFTNLISTHSQIGKTPIGELLDIGNNQYLGFTLSGGSFLNNYRNFSGTIVMYDLANSSVTKITDIKSIKDSISFTGFLPFDGSPSTLKHAGMVKASNNKIYFTYKTYQTGCPSSLYYSELQTNVRFCELDLATNQMQELMIIPFAELVQPLEYTNGKMLLSILDSVEVYNINTHAVEAKYLTHDVMTYGFMSGKFTKGSNGKIYGLTVKETDSTASTATLFSLDTANSFSFTALHQFDSVVFEPNIGLTEVNGKLYGSTSAGGTFNNGYLFSLDISNNQFAVVYNFQSKIDGADFAAGWSLNNNKLYSTSFSGGEHGYGTLVEFNPANNGLTVLSDLTINNGRPMYSTPVFSTYVSAINDLSKPDAVTVYPNPANQTISIKHSQPYDKIEIFNVSAQLVYYSEYKTTYNISTLNNGFYFVRIINGDKSSIEKLIIQKL